MTGTCNELSWLRSLLLDLRILHPKPALFYCDNKSALHTEMDCHFIHDKIKDGSVKTKYISSADQLTYVFTKLNYDIQDGHS